MPFLPTFYTVQVAFAPLPYPFLSALESIEVETSTDGPAMFRLRFALSRTPLGDWDVLQFDIFRPLVPIRLSVFLGWRPETLVNGFVTEAKLDNKSQPGGSVLEVVGMDSTGTLMGLQEQPFPWPNLPDSAIAAALFGKYAMVPDALPTAATRTVLDVTTTQRTSDIRLLKRMAERNGFECYVQPDPILGMDVGHFHPPRLLLPPQAVVSTDFGPATNLESFNVSYAMLEPTSALAVALDPATRAPMPAAAPPALELPMAMEPTLGRIPLPPIVRPAGADAANAAELLALTQSIAHRSSRCVEGSGEVDGLRIGRVLRPGLPLTVRGAGRLHSGSYYVTSVNHSLSTERYTQSFRAWRNAVGLTGAELFIDPFAAVA